MCDDIINNEVTCEDIVRDDENVVSSTETSPVKIHVAAPPCKRHKESSSVRMLQMSKKAKNEEILSATKKAKLLFGPVSSQRASQLEDLSGTYPSSREEDISAGSTVELIKEIKMLKRQLQEKTRSGKCVLMYVYRSMCPL